MTLTPLSTGFIPLLDAAPLIVARTMGFAEEEGLALHMTAAPSWSTLRDMLAFGQIEAAHMLAPVPVAMALGLGGVAVPIDALQVLAVGGSVIGLSRVLAARMRDQGYGFDFADAAAAGRALIAGTEGVLRMGVPFPFSMHAELVYYWLSALGVQAPQALDVRTVPPPLMAEAMAAGEIDAFCVGEPWGSIAVENGVGELLLPATAIWSFPPEKVLAVRHAWAEAEPDTTGRLMRAVWRAGRWCADPHNHLTLSEILARPEHLNVSAEILDRVLASRLVINPQGDERSVPAFIDFHAGATSFPWRSQAAWIGARLAERNGLDRVAAGAAARAVFRSDLYRLHLGPAGADLPAASSKREGALHTDLTVESGLGRLTLLTNRFFDGTEFDPDWN